MGFWSLRTLIVLDVLVCVLFLIQLQFDAAGLQESAGFAVPNDLRLLFMGIYLSWTMALILFCLRPQWHADMGLRIMLFCSAVVQIPIALSLNCSDMFRNTNLGMLAFWIVAYGYALFTVEKKRKGI